MPKIIEHNYKEWFKKANEDELSAESILKEKSVPSAVCFLSQQMVEKYLKGLLVLNHKKFFKVHDLLQIESLLLEVEPEIKNYEKELDLLNRYYVETRYPGDFPEFFWDEAEKAFEAAKKIKEFVIQRMYASMV
ncbi:MAG: HEPN domain-containing protein [Candidatus Kuenenbacteria bacterium]